MTITFVLQISRLWLRWKNTITVLGEETIRNGHDFEVIGMAR